MNKYLSNTMQRIAVYLYTSITLLLISGCAGGNIITIEDSVVQQHDLIDYDSDGVIKTREKCEGTTIGAAVDNYGCGTKISTIKPFKVDIKFEHNSYEIPRAAYSEISKLAELLAKNPTINVLIEGHSSKVGTVSLNQTLSDNRAQAVALVLENDFTINKNRISSVGYGFEKLAVNGDTEEAHAANRRIIAEISYTDSIDELKWTIYTVDQVN